MNQSGQITLFAIFPLLLIVAITIVASSGIISVYSRSQKICRSQLLKAQDHQSESLARLLSLNPAARILRIAKNFSKQIILDRVQKSIIFSGNFYSAHELNTIAEQFRKQFGDGQIKILGVKPPTLKVTAFPKNQIAPEYKIQDNFEEKQMANVKFELVVSKIFPPWLMMFLPAVQDLTLNCNSTLKRRGDSWKSALTMVN